MHSPVARVPVRFFPCSLKTNWGVSQNGSVPTFLFLGLENAFFQVQNDLKRLVMGISTAGGFLNPTWSQAHGACKARLPPTDTQRGVACHCSIVRYNKGAVDYQWSTGPHLPLLKNTIGMKESLMWDTGYILSDWKKTLCLNIHNICWWVRTGSRSLVCWDWAGQMSLHFKQLLPPPSLVLEMKDNRLAPFDWKLLEGRNYILLRFLFFLGWTSCRALNTGWQQQFIKWAFTILTVTIIIKLKPNSGAHKNEPR